MTKKLNSKFLSKITALMLSVVLISTASSSSILAATTTTTSKADSIAKGGALNEQIAQEGMVLLKNDNGALPIAAGSKLTVFGYASIRPNGGGSSDGADQSAGKVRLSSDVYSSLKDAGYTVNPTVKQQYTNWTKTVKDGGSGFTSDYKIGPSFAAATANGTDFKNSLASYNDAAVVVLTPTSAYSTISLFGGYLQLKTNDGKSLNADAVPEGDDPARAHTFMIDKAQHEMLKYANDNFSKVIVVINTSQNMELGFLNDKTKYPNIKAAILAGEPGANGFNALGQIMNGSVNPSGRTVDTFAKDLTKSPAWVNFGSNGTQGVYPAGLNAMMGLATTPEGNGFVDAAGKARAGYFSDYEEGIYVGYRYYETRGYTELQKNPASTWYDDNVIYPFGYGLSYTTFSKKIILKNTLAANSTLTKDSIISVEVKVTNTGKVAGKEVVQLYYTAPYIPGGIEKAFVVLGDFAKTDLLAPGESQTVTLKIKASDMASYDWKTDKTYVLDEGTYSIKIMNNSHDLIKSLNYKVASKILFNTSASGETITNRFDEVNDVILSSSGEKSVLSRNNWEGTWPKVPTINAVDPTKDGRYISDVNFKKLNASNSLTSAADIAAPYYSATAPKVADPNTRPQKASVLLQDLTGKPFTDPLWDSLLDELSLKEMMDLLNNGGFKTIEIPYIGKPYALDTDGPKGWSGNGASTGANGTGAVYTVFAAAPVVASTWSKDLANKFGAMIGEQAYWGNSDATTGTIKSYNGWYAPAMNIHRTPLDMRYNEYYSEDGLLAGEIAANVIQGAMSKGIYVTMKHFALHEDGGLMYRGMMASDPDATSGLSIWVNEQAMREIYLKPFQISVEQGKVQAVMTSLSRIGYTWAGASYPLLTQVLRDEWGFKGFVISDITMYGHENANLAIRAGGDLMLNSGNKPLNQVSADIGDPVTHLTALRRAVKNVLYVVANSTAMSAPPNTLMKFTPVASGTLAEGKAGKTYTTDVSGTITYSNKAKDANNSKLGTTSNTFAAYYTVSAGKLPAGLTLNSSTGVISGIISSKSSVVRTYNFTVSLTVKGISTSAKNKYSIKVTK